MTSGDVHPWQIAAMPMIEPEFLAGVLASAADIAVIVDPKGTVIAALADARNSPYGSLDHWVGKPLGNFLTPESVAKFDRLLEEAEEEPLDPHEPRRIELNHQDPAVWQFPVSYSAHGIGHEGAILLLGRDLRQVAETQQQLVQAQLALEQGYEERREFDARYRMLMTATSDAFVVLSAAEGRIRDLNAGAASLLGETRDSLQGALFAQEFKDRRRDEFAQALLALALSEVDADITVQTKRTGRNLTITPFAFRARGERLLICRLEPEEASHSRDDLLSANLNALFRSGTDAMVFTDAKGNIEAANEAFLELVDVAHNADVRGRNLADYMARGQIDLNVMLDNAVRSGHMRVYSTKLANDVGIWTSVELSVTYLNNRPKPSLAFVIRDATRAEAVRGITGTPQEAPRSDVVNLVGSAPLKEIVAETNDIIERMCIETALNLTSDNRAAAAEMLGLSRQSLYVKLRKYGLLEKSDGS